MKEKSKFYRQANSKRVQHQQTSFIRNVKRTSLSEKEKATTRNKKITRRKKLISKGKHKVKVVRQTCTEQVERLKNQSSKINLYPHQTDAKYDI